MEQNECYQCGGSGEVVFVAHGDPEQREDCFGCPACIARERDELEQELHLYRALCDGYTLDEMRRMSLTFKAQIDVLRGRVAVPVPYRNDTRTAEELSLLGCNCVRFGEGNRHWPCAIHAAARGEVQP